MKSAIHNLLKRATLWFILGVIAFLSPSTALSPTAAFASENKCLATNRTISSIVMEVKDYFHKLRELRSVYQRSVSRMVDAQADGLRSDIHRDTAVKALTAQKKIKDAIQRKRSALKEAVDDYCANCTFAGGKGAAKDSYCRRCPRSPACR